MAKAKINNCRYNGFIILFYFSFSSYIKDNEDISPNQLKDLNNLIVKLSEEVNDKITMILLYIYKKINMILSLII